MNKLTELPDWLILTAGTHTKKCGVCLEECVAILSGQEKNDNPDNVHPIIRQLGVNANDSAPNDEERTKLALTLGCQKDTADVDAATTLRLGAFVCAHCAENLPVGTHESVGAALQAAAVVLLAHADGDPERIAVAREGAARAARAADYAADAYAARAADAWAADYAAAGAAAYAAAYAADAADADYAARARDLLLATLDEFERLTGRTECATFTDEDWGRVRIAMEGEND